MRLEINRLVAVTRTLPSGYIVGLELQPTAYSSRLLGVVTALTSVVHLLQ